ncbi:hypothetical protein [Burkholderia sp. Ac-20344]|uniref:hypothetical protein n=1 Tax=Burkholderia sp. Ac-20344 TaxID=2703890 RepID=UPI00197C3672|nr:hypothetical protein [Burkholderia sp. Ac-20344]MBN3835255.1 hypothetical protein [Burkholderia sp. Ac-20344]
MFAAYKGFISKYLFLIAVIVSAKSAMADEKDGVIKCGPGDECSTIVPKDSLEAKNLCPNSSMQISWNKKSDWTLMSCSCNCSEQSNENWFVSHAGAVVELQVGRYFPRSFFSKSSNPTVPDIMASHSMCKPADPRMVERSAFVLLDKRPSDRKDPYCYDVIYAIDRGEDIDFMKDEILIKKSNHNYFAEVDDSEKNNLRLLAKKMAPSWVEVVDRTGEKELVVAVKRAYLYDQPSSQAAGKAYLIDGDKVRALGDAKNGFIKFRYVTRKGMVLEKWLKCEDVNYCINNN